jgi:DNA replication and repair protein RecF
VPGTTTLARLELQAFRNYEAAELEPAPGLTVVTGGNGEGKTNLLEAIAWLATLSSFRGAPSEALVRQGDERAVLRASVVRTEPEGGPRTTLVEAELTRTGRDRVLVNKSPLRRSRELLGTVRTTVFSPDDLALVKGGPGERRRFLDDLLVAWAPRHAATRADLERVLRQRGALLRSAGGRATPDVVTTLDVWDAKLTETGEALGQARARLVERLVPLVASAHGAVAGEAAGEVGLLYAPAWRETGLAAALAAARTEDLRRAVTTVGPHRDDLDVSLDGRPARTHASQGEQRSLALALRLAGHHLVAEVTGAWPVLLLDDVFSELDATRAAALLEALPSGQALLTTAVALPGGAMPELVVRVREGRLLAAAGGSPVGDVG